MGTIQQKRLAFFSYKYKRLLPKIDELKSTANKTKAAIIEITESTLDHTVPDLEINSPMWEK